MGGLLQTLSEFKGRQELFRRQTPQVLESLPQVAIIESTESSNRIEGVTVAPERFKELMLGPAKPKDRSEAEILGYRSILSQIHTTPDGFSINEETIRGFHRRIYAQTDVPAGHWKRRDNTIEERLPDGRWITRFVPISARQTPTYMKELCIRFDRLRDEGQISTLLLVPALILDFLCIHPFTDGNGRVSRLLTVLLPHQADYEVGRSALFDIDGEYVFSNHLTRLRSTENVHPLWKALVLHWLWTTGYFESICKRWVNQAAVSKAKLLKTGIPLPPLKEQRRIVARIEEITRRVEEARRLQQEMQTGLEKVIPSVPSRAFRGEL